MGTGLIFAGDGFKAFGMVLERFSQRIEDPTPVWDGLADRFVELQKKNFSSQGSTMSGGWSPLSPKYGAWKATHYPGRPILVRTGELKDSLAGKLGIREFNRKSMTVGTQVAYAAFHQNGTRHMPARRLIGDIPVDEQREWAKVLQRYLIEGNT
ncbi:phage virion morphogenesis protein [Glutamicibacter sp. AGC13]|uniref:phage virion morphogenesis protein n=1 Tax=Glutamicibacter sp. 2E12 TaxID=3416181 RepID=UPI003CFA4298